MKSTDKLEWMNFWNFFQLLGPIFALFTSQERRRCQMTMSLYEKALDQVALRYARTIKANHIRMTSAELAALVEKNWPKIVAEALAIHDKILKTQAQAESNSLQPAA
jgi:hypothetical protein